MKINWFRVDSLLAYIINAFLYQYNKIKDFHYNSLINYLKMGSFCNDCDYPCTMCECNENENENINLNIFISHVCSKQLIEDIISHVHFNFHLINNLEQKKLIKIINQLKRKALL